MKMNVSSALGLFIFVFAAGFIAGVVVVQGNLVKVGGGDSQTVDTKKQTVTL